MVLLSKEMCKDLDLFWGFRDIVLDQTKKMMGVDENQNLPVVDAMMATAWAAGAWFKRGMWADEGRKISKGGKTLSKDKEVAE